MRFAFRELCGGWDDDENSWYEDLYTSKYDRQYRTFEERWNGEPFNVGDIIMVRQSQHSSTGSNFVVPHRVFVISAKDEKDGVQSCQGVELSSRVNKSNKYMCNDESNKKKDWWKSNVYIDNYTSILSDACLLIKRSTLMLGLYTHLQTTI